MHETRSIARRASTRRTTRMTVRIPVLVTLVSPEGTPLGLGQAVLCDLSDAGFQISEVRLDEDSLPLRPHDLVIVPEGHVWAGIWIKGRAVRVAFLPDDLRIGARIVSVSSRFLEFFDGREFDP